MLDKTEKDIEKVDKEPEIVKTIKVRYKATQGAEDLYVSVDKPHRVYARQEANVDDIVFWHSTNKWVGGYEADCPIREGIAFCVVDRDDKVLFEEVMRNDTWNGGTSAAKKGPFYNEALKALADEFEQGNGLASYEEWRDALVADKEKHGYAGYRDNWMYWETECLKKKVLGETNVLGDKCFYVEEHMKHKISGREWMECLLMDKNKEFTLALCGYKLDNVRSLLAGEKESLNTQIKVANGEKNSGANGKNKEKEFEHGLR